MKYGIIAAAFPCLILLSGCPEDNNDTGILNDEQREIQNEVLALQKNSYILLTDLQQEMSFPEAIESVLAAIITDPSVDCAISNKQGIFIQYKSGIRGGIFFNYGQKVGEKINPENDLKSMPLKETNTLLGTKSRRKFPSNKNSVYVSPVHEAFGPEGELSLLFTETYLSTTAYNDFKKYY